MRAIHANTNTRRDHLVISCFAPVPRHAAPQIARSPGIRTVLWRKPGPVGAARQGAIFGAGIAATDVAPGKQTLTSQLDTMSVPRRASAITPTAAAHDAA